MVDNNQPEVAVSVGTEPRSLRDTLLRQVGSLTGKWLYFDITKFGLSNVEIWKLLNFHHTLVNRYINQTRDKIICGEIALVKYTNANLQAAMDRLRVTMGKRKAYDKNRRGKGDSPQIKS